MSELAVASLFKSFRGIRAVDDVSFSVGDGEFLALIGPNGAGKSTCFNTINGQLAPDSGTIRFDGRDIAGLPPRRRPYLSDCRDFRLDDGGRERADGADRARARNLSVVAAGGVASSRPCA